MVQVGNHGGMLTTRSDTFVCTSKQNIAFDQKLPPIALKAHRLRLQVVQQEDIAQVHCCGCLQCIPASQHSTIRCTSRIFMGLYCRTRCMQLASRLRIGKARLAIKPSAGQLASGVWLTTSDPRPPAGWLSASQQGLLRYCAVTSRRASRVWEQRAEVL